MAADGARGPALQHTSDTSPPAISVAHQAAGQSPPPVRTRAGRLEEFFRRLLLAPTCRSADSAFEHVRVILNAVEDELSGIPYDPCHPRRDGRLYPAKASYRCRVPGRPDLRRYRFKAHTVYLGASGAILIRHNQDGVVLEKPGSDGATVDLDPAIKPR